VIIRDYCLKSRFGSRRFLSNYKPGAPIDIGFGLLSNPCVIDVVTKSY